MVIVPDPAILIVTSVEAPLIITNPFSPVPFESQFTPHWKLKVSPVLSGALNALEASTTAPEPAGFA